MQEERQLKTRYFCSLFDSNYLLKGLAMIRSLASHCSGMHIYVLCMDYQTQQFLDQLAMPYVTCIALADIESEELLKAKSDRGVAEYCWTLSSCFTWYVMQHYIDIDLLTYVDADIFFYSDVSLYLMKLVMPLLLLMSIVFSPASDRVVNGRFCIEWNSFRRDARG